MSDLSFGAQKLAFLNLSFSSQNESLVKANVGWSASALLISAFILLPIVSVIFLAVFPTDNIWPHLMATTLPRYISTTILLMISVGTLAGIIGTLTAWLVVRYSFTGSIWLQWALLMPLAIPGYVGAYALVDLLEYAGPIQSILRETFGWSSSQDYWFPEIRSFGAAVFVLSLSLYPYVYLLTRVAFRDQASSVEEVARSLGAPPFERFFKISLPLARPAVAAGVAIVMMETVNDFGTVDYFAVQTLTTGIFSVWLQSSNVGGAAQLACVVLTIVILLVSLEKLSRRRMQFFNMSSKQKKVKKIRVHGAINILAFLCCFMPVLLGFALPLVVLAEHSMSSPHLFLDKALIDATWNTVFTGTIAAAFTVFLSIFMVFGMKSMKGKLPKITMPITTIGYAVPGAVLGVGILIPLAALDNAMADAIYFITDIDLGLIFTGTSFAIILAYIVRFFAIGQSATEAALGRISPNLEHAARSLGKNRASILNKIYLPIIKGSLGSAMLLVFVDCVKELPATLLLRPFNFDTLSTRVHEQASLEDLANAAPAAIYISLVGLCAVVLLARTNRFD
jgi:iron(III) transport system permease protein